MLNCTTRAYQCLCGVIMIYSQAALGGSLLLASSVELEVWDAEFSAQFVNGETQQAASPTPKKLEQEDGPPSTGCFGGAGLP